MTRSIESRVGAGRPRMVNCWWVAVASEKKVQVKVGMLADDDRARIVRSNFERIPLVVATLTGYVHTDDADLPGKHEPWFGQGIVATWGERDFWLALDRVTVQVPWLSAVRTWIPGSVSQEDIRRTIQAYSYGKVEVAHA